MNLCMVWSIHEGGEATISMPPMGTESLESFESAVAIMFRNARRAALQIDGRDPGLVEYESWLVKAPDASGGTT